MTLQEQFAKALVLCGEQEVNIGRSRKWKQYTNTPHLVGAGLGYLYYFLGNSGSLRKGNNYTTSIPVSPQFKKFLLAKL